MVKIAIIEDDLAIAQMYRLKFEAEGYKVEIAANGKLGLELCEEMQPDMVLLDLMMPEMNGDEMLEKMRKADWGKKPQVIILTNVSEQEARADEGVGLAEAHVAVCVAHAERDRAPASVFVRAVEPVEPGRSGSRPRFRRPAPAGGREVRVRSGDQVQGRLRHLGHAQLQGRR